MKNLILIFVFLFGSYSLSFGQLVGCRSDNTGNVFTMVDPTFAGGNRYTNPYPAPPFAAGNSYCPPYPAVKLNNCSQYTRNNYNYGPQNTQTGYSPNGTIAPGTLIYFCPIDDWLFLLIIPVMGFSIYSIRYRLLV